MLSGLVTSILLFLFVCLQVQCWVVPAGYSRLRSDGSAWRFISRDDALWLDVSADYVRDNWLRIQGWHLFDAFFGDPVIATNRWMGLELPHHFSGGATSRWIFPYWPVAVLGLILSIRPVAETWRARIETRHKWFRESVGAGLFVLAVASVIVAALVALWLITLPGLFILLVCGALGITIYDRLFPVSPADRNAVRCRKCKYDLTGNESGICPECGTPIRART
jgi:hypothetical protein